MIFKQLAQKRRTLGALFALFRVRLFSSSVEGKVRLFGSWVRYLGIFCKVSLFYTTPFSRKRVTKRGQKAHPMAKRRTLPLQLAILSGATP